MTYMYYNVITKLRSMYMRHWMYLKGTELINQSTNPSISQSIKIFQKWHKYNNN